MGFLSEDTIRRVRDATDIVQLAESYSLQLKRSGSTLLALCPFHNEKTPSFNVNPQLQFFKCFGCGVGGDVFKFVQLMERVEFPDSVELLAQRVGVEVEYDRRGSDTFGREDRSADRDERNALLWANKQALKYYTASLHDPEQGRTALDYLRSRGFTDETIRTWSLGWSPDLWDGLYRQLLRGTPKEKHTKVLDVAIRAGVLRDRVSESGDHERRIYDAFRGRVMFPILNNQSLPIGFGGRVLEEKPKQGGKYVNTSEGRLFHKRRLLFGLSFAAKEIGLTRTAIVVEGYTDTIMCHQHGIRNVVATLGTSLTEEHIQLLRRYVQPDGRVIALFDSDEAGEKATYRAAELFMEEDVPLQIVRGLAVKDAGDFLPKYGAEAFREELNKAVDSFTYAMQKALRGTDGDISAKAAAVAKIMDMVNRSPNRVKRDLMRKEISAVAGVPESSLPQMAPKRKGATAPQPGRQRGLQATVPSEIVSPVTTALQTSRRTRVAHEGRLLRYMIEREDWCHTIVDHVPPDMLQDGDYAVVAAEVRDMWQAGIRPDPKVLTDRLAHTESAGVLVDFFLREDSAPLTDAELNGLISRIEVEEMESELKDIRAELMSRPDDDELIQQKLKLEIAIRKMKTGDVN